MARIREHLVEIGRMGEIGRDPEYNTPILGFIGWRSPLAHVAVIRGKELVDANGQRYAETVWKLTFDFYDVEGLDEAMLIRCDGRTFDIKAIRPDMANKDETVVEGVEREVPAT